MIKRNERGKLSINSLDLQVLIDGLFMECKTEAETEWIKEQLESCIEISAEDTIQSIIGG